MSRLRFLGKEVVLGMLIALLSVLTALASYQGSIADSQQTAHEVRAMQNLNDGNAEYIRSTQFIIYDFQMYDGWYTTSDPDLEVYYQESYSPELKSTMETHPDDPFGDAYQEAMYAPAFEYWDESDTNFELAGQWDNRGDGLQLVVLIMALGLAFAAWGSLLKEESNMRTFFAIFAIIMLVVGLLAFTTVSNVA